jgi:RNA polymerase sigma-70 factor (family 1)
LGNKADISQLWAKTCLEDDLKSFELLFYALSNRLIKFCVLYVHQKEVAEEIVSEVFLRCWENRRNLDKIISPETYLFVAVKNQSLNYIKKYSHIHLVQIESTDRVEFVNTYNPEKEMERKELHFLLDQAIARLPQQACIIFKLIKEDGMKYKDVAAILDISHRTVQTQLFRAIKKLSIILADYKPSSKTTNIPSSASPAEEI